MDIITNMDNGWVILSKSNCKFCDMVVELLKDVPYNKINCDDILANPKTRLEFLDHVKKAVGKEIKYFPMVFHNQLYIGGFKETLKYLELGLYDKFD